MQRSLAGHDADMLFDTFIHFLTHTDILNRTFNMSISLHKSIEVNDKVAWKIYGEK